MFNHRMAAPSGAAIPADNRTRVLIILKDILVIIRFSNQEDTLFWEVIYNQILRLE